MTVSKLHNYCVKNKLCDEFVNGYACNKFANDTRWRKILLTEKQRGNELSNIRYERAEGKNNEENTVRNYIKNTKNEK